MTDILVLPSRFRAPHEDDEYQSYLADAKRPAPKLWLPYEQLHRSAGGNIVVRPEPADRVKLTPTEMDQILRQFWLRPIRGGAGPSAWTFTNNSRTNMLSGNQAIGTDTFKMALLKSTSNIGAASNTYAALTNETTNGNGYTTGGVSVTLALSGTTTVTVTITDATWTASGGTIVARFAVVYEVSANVTVFCTLDSAPADITVADGNALTVSGSNNLFTLA